MARTALTLLLGLLLGAALGVAAGWLLPLEEITVGFEQLHPDHELEVVVMVGSAYAASGDWETAQARLERLAKGNPAAYVTRLAERAIEQGRSAEDIRSLARLAVQLGYTTPAMQPYIAPTVEGS